MVSTPTTARQRMTFSQEDFDWSRHIVSLRPKNMAPAVADTLRIQDPVARYGFCRGKSQSKTDDDWG